jgi:hypothetical protein
MTHDEGPRVAEHESAPDLEGPRTTWLHAASLSLLIVVGYVSPPLTLVSLLVLAVQPAMGALLGIAAASVLLLLLVKAHKRIRARGAHPFQAAADVLVFGLLPIWGLFYAFGLARDSCIQYSCDDAGNVHRPFAASGILGLVVLHLIVVLAYAVSKKRPEALRPWTELAVLSTLLLGMLLNITVAVQFGPWILAGFLFPPLFIPTLTPVLSLFFLGVELLQRLRRRGRESLEQELLQRNANPEQPVYRGAAPPPALVEVPLVVHRGLLKRAIVGAPALIGLYFVVHAAATGRSGAALEVFTQTCGHTLSTLPIETVTVNCHYLCTVAARGHDWLVRPERFGQRGGLVIVVNRQLATANAFEDLLHERWPRFGRLARRVYDRLGLPVSRYLRWRWLADFVYLAMKPAEWLFYVALLLLDRGSPEARIDRMYR